MQASPGSYCSPYLLSACVQTAVMTALGHAFGLSHLQAARAGLLLAAGGEFAFVTFGEAVQHKILPAALVSKLFLVVALSMALTPFLAEGGAKLGKVFEKSDMKVRWAACRMVMRDRLQSGWARCLGRLWCQAMQDVIDVVERD